MLQNTGTGHHAFLRNMADNEDGNAHSLGNLHQNIGRLPHLADASGRCGNIFSKHRLNRVYDHDLRLGLPDRFLDGIQVCFAQKKQLSADGTDPAGPHLDLL